ncbi:MAG: hypothetical protein E7314_04300 [Clostridiales bacterium]|nr:hypothetical protein [Clostridiales bacterium]
MNKFSTIISWLALVISIVALGKTIDGNKGEKVYVSLNSEEHEKVYTFVKNNLEIIKSDIEQNDFTKTLDLGLVKSVQVKDNLVDFQCVEKIDEFANGNFGFFYTNEEDFNNAWGKYKKSVLTGDLKEGQYEVSTLGIICDKFYYYYSNFISK